MYYRLGGGNIKTGVFKSQNTLAKGAVTCTVYPLGATVKFSLLSAPSAWKWGSLALSSLFPSPLALPQPIPLLVPVLSIQPRSQPQWNLPSTSPGQGRCLQPFCVAGGTSKAPNRCLIPALPRPLSRLPVCIMENDVHGGSRGRWLSSTCLGPAGMQTRANILFWEAAFVASLPDPASFPSSRIVTAAQETPGKASRRICCVSLLPSYPPARTN